MIESLGIFFGNRERLQCTVEGIGMSLNFDLSEEHRIFWDAIASFVDKEIAPLVDEAEAKEEFPVPLFKKLGGLGYLCCRYPEQYGGAGADKISECLYMEELNRVCAGIAPGRLLWLNSSVVRRHRTSSTRPFSSSADTAS